ncbi:nucleoporin POM33 [Sugiyamaella lignohabitans]|uniref:Nucleoporin POM33 n=1 Tax=Sugiyamaella lignohabitans TaxID=796027 RepID=A0A167EBL4_9ASCO|nr:nucleoporin POM33 [Sugiyamaella lignohabitans]ANB13874.1 nucleoporin POM33 [Sugiyamaella lignohabitans]
MAYAANFEFGLVFLLFFKFVTFRKGTTFPFLFYIVFIKARYDQSYYMKSAVKAWEVKIDSVFANPNIPAPLKQAWAQVKDVVKRITSAVTIGKPVAPKKHS